MYEPPKTNHIAKVYGKKKNQMKHNLDVEYTIMIKEIIPAGANRYRAF